MPGVLKSLKIRALYSAYPWMIYAVNMEAAERKLDFLLQNGACTHRCISKQIHYKTTFSHNSYMKSLEFYENYITLL